MNLYLVTCKGMTYPGYPTNGVAYVVAKDCGTAYEAVRHYLDKHDLGFASDRALDKVELLAEDAASPECGYRLFIP